jgi:hypothetical protein
MLGRGVKNIKNMEQPALNNNDNFEERREGDLESILNYAIININRLAQ